MSTTMPPESASADDHVQADYGGYWQGGTAQPSMPPTGAPQPPGYYPYMGAPAAVAANVVKNYMVQAVLCTLFLCLPTGIAAIYFAAKVNPA